MGNILKAVARLSLKDKLILLVCFCLVIGFMFMGLINLSMKGIVSGQFPSSELAMIPDAQQYEKMSYDDLPYEVNYPLSDIVISVGGTEGNTDDFGSSVIYDSDYAIITFCIEKDYATTVNNHFAGLLGKKRTSPYVSGESEHGYRNTLEVNYEAGKLGLNDAPRYILSYVYKDVGVSVITKDDAKLRGAKKLLDRLLMTIGNRTTKEEGAEETSAPSDAVNESTSDAASSSSSDLEPFPEDYFDGYAVSGNSYSDFTKELSGEYERMRLSTDVEVAYDIEDAVFSFDYTNSNTMPEAICLTSPSGKEYAADYINEEGDGKILFYVKNPEKGMWNLFLLSEEGSVFGGYTLYVHDRESYERSLLSYSENEAYMNDGGLSDD